MLNTNSESDLDLGDFGAGLMQWGTTWIDDQIVNPKGNLTDEEVKQLWKTCRAKNILFFDTAEGYGGGTSELRIKEVRDWYSKRYLHGKPDDKIVVATKYLPTLWRWTRHQFLQAVRASADRLGVDVIDLYFIHTPIHPLPIECFVQWACDAVDEGLIKEIGISNCNADLTRRAEAVAQKNGKHICCNQIMLSLLVWQSEKHRETVRSCHELGIQIAAYSPIGQGLLTDNLTEKKFRMIRAVKMTGVTYPELLPLRSQLQTLSQKYSCTMAQVAINWVRGHGAVPLIGCRSVHQIEDVAESLKNELTKEEVESLDKVSLGLSVFERPLYRRSLFVVFISILQLAYNTELWYDRVKTFWCEAYARWKKKRVL